MKKYALIATLACVGIGSMAIYAQQGRMAQIVAPQATVHRAADIPVNNVGDQIQAKGVRGQTVLLSQTYLQEGAMSPHHNHPEEELLVVISGRLRAMTSDGDVIMEPGDVFLIESSAEHQVVALEDTYMVEAFGPGRVVGAQ